MEAHSTDYQPPQAYKELIRDGFSILKVGPALTFALREALYSLAAIERELVHEAKRSRLVETMEEAMLTNPSNWQKYYRGGADQERLLRVYSYSDRIRYYWNLPEAESSVARLVQNLRQSGIPETLVSQHFPRQYGAIRAGTLSGDPKALAIANIRCALAPYSQASN
jgi:D-tagatose-1,6-bisphosphate aldolase subunit GatZ/KbaZ